MWTIQSSWDCLFIIAKATFKEWKLELEIIFAVAG